MWEPPRRLSTRSVSGSPGGARACSSPSSESAGRAGSSAGPPQDLVDEQVAEPGDPGLVHQDGLQRRPRPATATVRSSRRREVEGVGPEALFVGIELDRAEPARVAQVQGAAVGEAQPEPVPRRVLARCSRRGAGSPAASPSTSTRPLMPRWSARTGPSSRRSFGCRPTPATRCRGAAACRGGGPVTSRRPRQRGARQLSA